MDMHPEPPEPEEPPPPVGLAITIPIPALTEEMVLHAIADKWIARLSYDRLNELVVGRIDKMLTETLGEAARELLTARIDLLLTEGWTVTEQYGYADIIIEMLQTKDAYKNVGMLQAHVEKHVAEQLNKMFQPNGIFGDVVANSKAKLQAEVDVVLAKKIREALAETLGRFST